MYIYNICIIYHIPCIIFETFPYTQMLNNLGMFFLASIFEVGWCFPLFSKRIWNAPHLDIPWNGLLVASFHHKVFLGEPRKTLPYHKFWICWLCKNGESFWPSKNFQKNDGHIEMAMEFTTFNRARPWSSFRRSVWNHWWQSPPFPAGLHQSHGGFFLGNMLYTSYMIMIALCNVYLSINSKTLYI